MIYFIRAGSTDHIKIGWTKDSETLRRRVATLQIGHPLRLTVVRTLDAPRPAENWLHGFFSGVRATGEWFAFQEEMMTIKPPIDIMLSNTDTRVVSERTSWGIGGNYKIPTAGDVESMSVDAGISVAEACRRAGLAPTLYTRWRAGRGTSIENVRKIADQLELAISESAK